jgi:hypothetical protein
MKKYIVHPITSQSKFESGSRGSTAGSARAIVIAEFGKAMAQYKFRDSIYLRNDASTSDIWRTARASRPRWQIDATLQAMDMATKM